MRWFLPALAAAALFAAAAASTFVPLADGDSLQYAFVWPGTAKLGAAAFLGFAAVSILYFGVLYGVRRHAPARVSEAKAGAWLAPIVALGFVVLGFAPAVPGAGEWTSVIGYFFLDLRWWWFAAAILLVLIQIDRLTGSGIARHIAAVQAWNAHGRLLLFEGILFAVAISFAALTTPHLRSDTGFHGDEPKYVRYCEVWYQGGGLEVSQARPFNEVPLDAPPKVLNVVPLLVRTLRDELFAMGSDVRELLARPNDFQWNRARRDGGFLVGKRGGKYEIYQPGTSVFLCPGYFLDRYLLNAQSGYNGEFPRHTVMMHFSLLVVFGFTAVAVFRLLRHVLQSDVLALVWAAAAMLSLPTAAFAFQFYPELPSLLLIVWLTTHVWFHAREGSVHRALVAGALSAGLGWLHPRFLLISAVFTVSGVVTTRKRRASIAFLSGAMAVYLSIGFYAYHVTGSFMPTALWDAPGSEPTLNPRAIPLTVLAYAVDRTWGLLPHAPILLLAVPGLAVLFRYSRWRTIVLVATGLALGIPAAGHTLHAAGSTPGRLVVGVVALSIIPVALLVRKFWYAPAVRVLTVIAMVLSLEAAVSYNLDHVKYMGAIRASGLGGWRPNLAFPMLAGEGTFPANTALLIIVVTSVVACTAAAWWKARPGMPDPSVSPVGWRTAAFVFVTVVAVAVAATAFNRDWTRWEYVVDDRAAREVLASALVRHDRCRVCFTTREPAIDWRWLRPNATDAVNIEASVESSAAKVNVHLAGGEDRLRFGRMLAEFGDGSSTNWIGIVRHREIVHSYKQPGRYSVVVWVQLPNGEMRGDRRTLTIGSD